MRKSILQARRAVALGVLLVAIPITAQAGEVEPGGSGVDVGVEITPIPAPTTDEPTAPPPTDDATVAPTEVSTDDTTVAPTEAPTSSGGGELEETGFGGLPVLFAGAGLVVLGGAVLLYRRRLVT